MYSRLLKRPTGCQIRETDVLELIMRGRDVARMSETLFVSENTVRSHCKNLYRKPRCAQSSAGFRPGGRVQEERKCDVD